MKKRVSLVPLWIFIIVMIFSLVYSSISQADQNHAKRRHVLLLHSYHKGMTWADDITNSATTTLYKNYSDIELHVEYMDTKRVLGEEHLRNLYTEYHLKFKQERFDAVIVADDAALRFAMKYYDNLFPGVPVVFCGINNLESGMLDNRPEFTGILENLDVEETLKIALNLHPDVQRVYIINDMSESGKGLHKEIEKATRTFATRAEITFLEDYTADELAATISKLPPDSVILHSAFWIDKSGRSLPNEKIYYAAVGNSARVPVYSLWDFYMGLGIVGGKMISGTAQGELAAQLATRILNGEKPSSIPIVVKSPNRLIFDYQQMQRFGIDRSSLPPGSVVINEPPPFYAINKPLAWTGGLFALTMTFVTVLLVLNINRRKRAEEALLTLKDMLQEQNEELQLNEVSLRDQNDKLQATEEMLRTQIDEYEASQGLLKESEERFQALHNASFGGIFIHDKVLILDCNQGLSDLTGFAIEELVGMNGFKLIAPGWLELVRNNIQNDYAQRYEIEGIRKDGTIYPLAIKGKNIPYKGGTVRVVEFRDITDRKRAEGELIEQKNLITTIIESTSEAIYAKDIAGKYISINEAGARMLGYSAADVIGRTDMELVPAETASEFRKADEYIMSSGKVCEREESGVTGGKARTFYTHKAPWRDYSGTIIGVIGVSNDITDRKEHEKEQLKMEKLESLGILAGGIAHDFNNILTGIMGNISLAQKFLDATHKSFKPLSEAEKASTRAASLAHQLLTFARGGEPVKKEVSVQQLINETVSLVLHGSNVMGNIEIPDSIHTIEADEGQISQVFHNLIINATQAMPGGGTLTVTAQNEYLDNGNILALPCGNYVRLLFIDQGFGIPDDILKNIFDPYFTTKSTGKGLGLASVHSIVNKHGGHIGASSVVGKGAIFTIHLPSACDTTSKYRTNSVEQTIGNHTGGSVLVMDDEKMIRDMATEMLEYLGYSVTTCENGVGAIAQFMAAKESGVPFNAVIMDLTIPGGMGGKATAKEILAIDPNACLIVSSGYSNDPIMSDYSAFGFSCALAKPYKISDLRQHLSLLLASS